MFSVAGFVTPDALHRHRIAAPGLLLGFGGGIEKTTLISLTSDSGGSPIKVDDFGAGAADAVA